MTERDIAVNQRICAKLVEREVICCVSSLVDHFAKNEAALDGSEYSYEDVLDLCQRRVDHSERLEEIEEALEVIEEQIDELNDPRNTSVIEDTMARLDKDKAALEAEQASLEEEQDEPSEVYEHWVVSDFLARKLKEHGETVGELFNLTIWGRCTSGQSIAIDSVIVDIASSMEILEGQKNAWE